MLGSTVSDPYGTEGVAGTSQGLGVLNMHTELAQEKKLAQVQGRCAFAEADVSGYEIHMGVSTGPALDSPAFMIDGRPEGALSADDQVLGSYLHGMFDMGSACSALLSWAGLSSNASVDTAALREASLERIAAVTQPLLASLCGYSRGSSYTPEI